MTANGSATATVETLTAEVRTLMVGSRQVTLSVAKQLDVVALDELDVFGRINVNEPGAWVIGAHKQTRALVKSKIRPTVQHRAWIYLSDQPAELQRPQRCPRKHPRSGHHDQGEYYTAIDLQYDGWPVEIDPSDTVLLHDPNGYAGVIQCTDACNRWHPRDCRSIIADQVDQHRSRYHADQKLCQEAQSAPLIVLAGLR
jgi:hypothetical protein